MNTISNKILIQIIFFSCFCVKNIYSQESYSYNINAKLDIEKNMIEVVQSIKFKNISNKNLSEIYLEDWANSYINNESNLASRITDEYDRSFSFASKNRRGYTKIEEIQINSSNLDWSRLTTNNDIIKLSLNKVIIRS